MNTNKTTKSLVSSSSKKKRILLWTLIPAACLVAGLAIVLPICLTQCKNNNNDTDTITITINKSTMYYGEQGQTITANAASGKTVNLTAHGDENTTNNFDFDDGVLTPHASGADGIVTITATAGDIVEEATIKFMNKDTITITITKSTMYYGEQGQTITANASSGKTVNLTAHGDENTTNNFDFVDGVLTPHGSGNEGIVTITATAGDIVEEATVRLIPNSVNLISAPAWGIKTGGIYYNIEEVAGAKTITLTGVTNDFLVEPATNNGENLKIHPYFTHTNLQTTENIKVTKINDEAFKAANITGVVEFIAKEAAYNGEYILNKGSFSNCGEITEVKLHGAKIIGEEAFEDCAKLKTVWIPNSLYATPYCIGTKAFDSCPSLDEIKTNWVNTGAADGHIPQLDSFSGVKSSGTVYVIKFDENDSAPASAVTLTNYFKLSGNLPANWNPDTATITVTLSKENWVRGQPLPSQTYFQFTGTKGENISVADLGGTFTKDGDITPPRPISVLLDFPGALTDGKATVSGQAPKLSGTFHISFLLYDTYIVQNFDVTVQ